MANPYEQYAETFNKIGGTGGSLINGIEPLTISARKNQSAAMNKLRMNQIDTDAVHRKYARMVQDQMDKQDQAGLFDFLGLVPQVWSTANSIAGRNREPDTNFGRPTGGGGYY